MQELLIDTKTCGDEQGCRHTFRYYLLIEKILTDSFTCENFGVRIEEVGGSISAIPAITPSYTRIRELMELLCQNTVTPINLPEVLEDWL